MPVYLLEIDPTLLEVTSSRPDAILITPVPTRKLKLPTTPHSHQFHTQDNPAEMCAKSTSAMSTRGRYTSLRLYTAKIHGLDTNKRPLENNTRSQRTVLCKRLKAKKVILQVEVHTILLGVGSSIYTSHTFNHL